MKKQFLSFILLTFFYFVKAQIVNIPDANFKAYLVSNNQINTNGDSEIQVTEANSFTGEINCFDKNISDLTGIESFINLSSLDCTKNAIVNVDFSKNIYLKKLMCSKNKISSLDVSKNTALTYLTCGNNQLTNLDVTKNNALTYLGCGGNQLNSLDVSKNTVLKELHCSTNLLTSLNVNNNIALTNLTCSNNKLTSLDVSKNTILNSLWCDTNQLSSLDLSKNTVLNYLWCHTNQLSDLDLSKNTVLYTLICDNNKLTSLDITNNTALIHLLCNNNQLTSLDLSKNKVLYNLYCNNNKLTSLNLKNGNNASMTSPAIGYYAVIANNNPNLVCIQVDDTAGPNLYTDWLKDSFASYNVNCPTFSVSDISKKTVAIYPNPVKNSLYIQTLNKVEKAEIYSVTGQLLKTYFQKNIDVNDLPKGNYVLKIETDKGLNIEKFIKE